MEKEVWAQSPETYLALLPLALLGAGGAHARDINGRQILVRSPEGLRALGFDPSQIASVLTAQEGQAVHLRKIRKMWNQFYEARPRFTVEELLDHATQIDDRFGHLFNPAIR